MRMKSLTMQWKERQNDFLKNNEKIFNEIIADRLTHTANKSKEIISKAREIIGYQPTTNDLDIFAALIKLFKKNNYSQLLPSDELFLRRKAEQISNCSQHIQLNWILGKLDLNRLSDVVRSLEQHAAEIREQFL